MSNSVPNPMPHGQAQQAMTELDRVVHLESLIGNLPGMVYLCKLDAKWTVLYLSSGCLSLTGYRREQFGIEVEYGDLIHPEDAPRVWKNISEAVAQRQQFTLEYRIRTATEVEKWVWERGAAIINPAGEVEALEGFITDITERKRTEAELNSVRRLLEKAQEAGQLGSWISNPNSVPRLVWSTQTCRIFGLNPPDFDGRLETLMELVHPEDRQMVCTAAEEALKNKSPYQLEHRIVRPDGETRWVHERADVEIDANGESKLLFGVVQDITERKQMEERIRQSQKMEAIGQLAGGVAHDFNNILTVIQGHAAQMFGNPALPKDLSESVNEIANAAERAAGLTRQLLAFSRKQVLHMKVVDLNQIVADIFKMLHRILGEDIRLELTSSGTARPVKADAGMLEQVLLNLAVNARDAMPNGGRLILETSLKTLGAAEVCSANSAPGPFVCLKVSDTGCGIPHEILPRIFDPFFTTKEVGKGTGLGLATVYGIVEQHRGWISVESAVGQGTAFLIYLPAADSVQLAKQPETDELPTRKGTETILLVEDERALARLAKTVLEINGYKVLEVSNGLEALKLWEEHMGSIDLLFTDLVMPEGISGFELAEKLRKDKPHLRVLFSSGYSSDVFGRESSLKEGANFLQKPYLPKTLAKTVRECLDAAPKEL